MQRFVCALAGSWRHGFTKRTRWRRIIDLEPYKGAGVGAGALAFVYYSAKVLFRQVSKDKMEIVKDRIETDIVTKQFERIRELETANKDLTTEALARAVELGEVKGEVRALQGQVNMLEQTIAAMQRQIDQLVVK